jgi:hypothetical protein
LSVFQGTRFFSALSPLITDEHNRRATSRGVTRWSSRTEPKIKIDFIDHSGANILPHQASIFMLQNMAVIHKGMLARCRLIKGDKKLCLVFHEYRF